MRTARIPTALALAAAGAVLVTGCGGTSPSTSSTSAPPASSVVTPSAPAPSAQTPSAQTSSATNRTTSGVSKDEAGRIATNKYGGTVKNVESDHYQGHPAWEVEVRNSDKGRIEVKVSKSTGKILHLEHEDQDDD